MNTYFSSDYHMGHLNIIKYEDRPFKDKNNKGCADRSRCSTYMKKDIKMPPCSSYNICSDKMNNGIIHNHNSRVKPGDLVYHLGDFCFKGGIEGGKTKAQLWEEQLNGKIVHIEGNHDTNNGTNSKLKVGLLEFGNKVILAQHKPPTMRLEVPEFCDFVLCGHMHTKWKYMWLEGDPDSIPLINVGIDVWNFMPVKLNEILVYYDKIMKERK